jgi:hypothetical protein
MDLPFARLFFLVQAGEGATVKSCVLGVGELGGNLLDSVDKSYSCQDSRKVFASIKSAPSLRHSFCDFKYHG